MAIVARLGGSQEHESDLKIQVKCFPRNRLLQIEKAVTIRELFSLR